jgi:hypothetical protein
MDDGAEDDVEVAGALMFACSVRSAPSHVGRAVSKMAQSVRDRLVQFHRH